MIANKNKGFGILLEAVLVSGAGQAPAHRQQTCVAPHRFADDVQPAVSTVLPPRGAWAAPREMLPPLLCRHLLGICGGAPGTPPPPPPPPFLLAASCCALGSRPCCAVQAADASIVETLSKPDLVATVFAPDGEALARRRRW